MEQVSFNKEYAPDVSDVNNEYYTYNLTSKMAKQVRNNRPGFIHFAVFACSLTAFATGACFVWTSPLLPKFQSNSSENPIGRPVTISESAWIVSAMNLALICGPLLTILILKVLTKKKVLLLSLAPILVAHLTCCFATKAHLFIFARFLMGLGTGALWAVLGIYIAEISEDSNRGLLGSFPGILSNSGILFVYVSGPYLSIRLFSILNIIPIILFYIGFGFFVPDSPYDLVIKNKQIEAQRSMEVLRQRKNVEKELEFVQDMVESVKNDRVSVKDLFKDRVLRKGVLISMALMACQQLSGQMAVVSYAETIFKSGGDFIPSEISPIIMGIVSTISNIVSSKLVDRMGRKILFAGSCVMESISLFALGGYFYALNANFDVSHLAWVPITSLVLFMVFFSFALGNIPWIIVGEIFHSNVKTLASTIACITNFVLSFFVSICFPYMVASFGMGWTFWIFAVIMVLGSIFCLIFLPETKGKNFKEIQELLKK